MAPTKKLFSKKLTKTDISKRISIPSKKFTDIFPTFRGGSHAAELKVEDEEGRVWNMRCTIRKQKHKKPVISSGWTKFVRSKKLEVGDKVTLYELEGAYKEVEAAGAKYRLEVEKAQKVFGVTIGYIPLNRLS